MTVMSLLTYDNKHLHMITYSEPLRMVIKGGINYTNDLSGIHMISKEVN